jgi:tRNA(Ile)-lysidine synthase
MAGRKKIKDFFIDRKVDRSWRSKIPLVVAAGQIIWVVGMRRSELYRPRSGVKKVLRLTFQPENAFKNLSL